MGEETTIMGTVLSVVFQNEENGYAVLRLVTDDGELLTLVGCVPCAAPRRKPDGDRLVFLPPAVRRAVFRERGRAVPAVERDGGF